MSTYFPGVVRFAALSLIRNMSSSLVGDASGGYSLTNLSSGGRTLSATESTTANVAKVVACLIFDLTRMGILKGSF